MSLPFKPKIAWSKLYSSADARGLYFFAALSLGDVLELVTN